MNYYSDISVEDKTAIANGLIKLLADSYLLYLKTQNYHRNVTAPLFDVMRQMIEEQNTELAHVVDEITDRIWELGMPVPDSHQVYQTLSSIGETVSIPPEVEMINQLIHDHEIMIRSTGTVLTHTHVVNDAITAMLLTQNLRLHRKHMRALRALL